jgi:hypothetical protein
MQAHADFSGLPARFPAIRPASASALFAEVVILDAQSDRFSAINWHREVCIMRTTIPLVLFALISVGGFASEHPQSDPAVPSSNFDLLKKPSQSMQLENFQMPLRWDLFKKRGQAADVAQPRNSADDSLSLCFVLDTYVMRREDPQSDVTHPGSHTTCSPSTQYSLKNAVGVIETPTQ